MNCTKRFGSGGIRLGSCSAVIAFALAWGSQARAGYEVFTSAASSTALKKDGVCNLIEAIMAANGNAANSDCVDNNDGELDIVLFESPLPFAGHPFQLGSGVTISTTANDVSIFPESGSAFIEATGASAFTINSGSSLGLSELTVSHTGSSAGRLITNHGTFGAFDCTFQNGNLSTLTGASSYGAGIWSDGILLSVERSVVQNNNALNGRGGGIYIGGTGPATGFLDPATTIEDSVIQNNVAAQGGGLYADTALNTFGQQLTMNRDTINDNKAVTVEATTVPPPKGAFISAPNTGSCNNTTETPSHAFDDDLTTKWCATAAKSPATNNVSLIYQFATPQVISSYSITSANDHPERDPADWLFQGSTDGSANNWKTIHSVSNATFQAPSKGSAMVTTGRALTHGYGYGTTDTTISNVASYSFYRLLITKNNGDYTGTTSTTTQLAEVGLFVNGKTGDGGGIYNLAHSNFSDLTLARNIAGCTSPACACSDAWCAATIPNSSIGFGRGGGLFAGEFPAPETHSSFITVGANSASQGGGVYGELGQDWAWDWSIFEHNAARTAALPEPDFHGDPHRIDRLGGDAVGSIAGVKVGSNVLNPDGSVRPDGTGFLYSGDPYESNDEPCRNYDQLVPCQPDAVETPSLLAFQFNSGSLNAAMKTFMIKPGTSIAENRVPTRLTDANATPLDQLLQRRSQGPDTFANCTADPTLCRADWGATENPVP